MVKRYERNSFPIGGIPACGGGPGICLIRGNILMSKRITSYVCINLSCREPTRTRLHTRLRRYTVPRCPRACNTCKRTSTGRVSVCAPWAQRSARLRAATIVSPSNERYSIILKFNEPLVNGINEPPVHRY